MLFIDCVNMSMENGKYCKELFGEKKMKIMCPEVAYFSVLFWFNNWEVKIGVENSKSLLIKRLYSTV